MEAQQRDYYYYELMEITIIFLGVSPLHGRHYCTSGVMHKARWMAKVIDSFKVWMFRSQFALTDRDKKDMRDFCIFYATLHLTAWVTAPLNVAAPLNELTLMKSL